MQGVNGNSKGLGIKVDVDKFGDGKWTDDISGYCESGLHCNCQENMKKGLIKRCNCDCHK